MIRPEVVSPSDPSAQWTAAHKGPAFFGYSVNYLADVNFSVIIGSRAYRIPILVGASV
jgi:hypothetical protein